MWNQLSPHLVLRVTRETTRLKHKGPALISVLREQESQTMRKPESQRKHDGSRSRIGEQDTCLVNAADSIGCGGEENGKVLVVCM